MKYISVKKKEAIKSSGKCDNKQKYKGILEAAIFLNPEVFTDNSPMSSGPYVTLKNIAQENNFVNFLKFLISNRKNMSAG